MSKHILQSKTFWVMLIITLGGLFPQTREFVKDEPWIVSIVGAIGILLRAITKGKVELFSDDDERNRLPSLLVWITLAGLFMFSLSACSPAQREAIPVRASYTDKHGNVYAYDPQTGVSAKIIEAAK